MLGHPCYRWELSYFFFEFAEENLQIYFNIIFYFVLCQYRNRQHIKCNEKRKENENYAVQLMQVEGIRKIVCKDDLNGKENYTLR